MGSHLESTSTNMKLLWILCALAVLFSMVAAIPTGEKGELGSSVTGAVEDMDVAESKAKIRQESLESSEKSSQGAGQGREICLLWLKKNSTIIYTCHQYPLSYYLILQFFHINEKRCQLSCVVNFVFVALAVGS